MLSPRGLNLKQGGFQQSLTIKNPYLKKCKGTDLPPQKLTYDNIQIRKNNIQTKKISQGPLSRDKCCTFAMAVFMESFV